MEDGDEEGGDEEDGYYCRRTGRRASSRSLRAARTAAPSRRRAWRGAATSRPSAAAAAAAVAAARHPAHPCCPHSSSLRARAWRSSSIRGRARAARRRCGRSIFIALRHRRTAAALAAVWAQPAPPWESKRSRPACLCARWAARPGDFGGGDGGGCAGGSGAALARGPL